MKRYIVLVFCLLAIGTASAWNKFAQQCIATLAEQNLTEKAKSEVTKILGGDMASNSWWLQTIAKEEATKHTASWHYINVNAELKSTTNSTKDGVVQIERCAEILKNRAEHSDSTVVATLKTVIHLVADMHNLAHVKIANIPNSRRNFKIEISNGFTGKKAKITQTSWRKYWESSLINRHASFSAELFASDLEVCYGADKERFSKGDIRHWAADMASLAAPLYQWAAPDMLMSREQDNRLEPMNDKTMARAGYRLAALLNDIFK